MKRRKTQTKPTNTSNSSSTPNNNEKIYNEVLWKIVEEYFPLLKIIVGPFKNTNPVVVFIIIIIVFMIYPFWNVIKDYSDGLRKHIFPSELSSVLVPDDLSSPPRHRWVWRNKELLNITNQMGNLSVAHNGKQIHIYLVGGPGSGKSELGRQLGLKFYESLKQDRRPVDVVRIETDNLRSLMSSLIDAIFALSSSVGQKTNEIKKIEEELNFRVGDLFSNEGNTLKSEMKLKVLFTKLKELFKQRNSRPVLIFDNVRDLKLLQSYLPLEAGSTHFTTFIVIITLQKRVSLDRLNDYIHVMDLYEGMTEDDSVELLRLITGLEEDDENSAKELSSMLGRQPLALSSAAIYIESVREGPPRDSGYSYSNYISEFKKDIDKLGREEEVEWQGSDANKYADAMYIAVLKVVHLSAQTDPVFRDITCSVGYADTSHLSLSYILDFLETNTDFDFSKAKIRNSLKNVLFKISGEEKDQILSSHQVIREAFRRVCKVSCSNPSCTNSSFCILDISHTSSNLNVLRGTLIRISRTFERHLNFTLNMYLSVGEMTRFNYSFGSQCLDILTSLCIFSARERIQVEDVIMSNDFSKMFIKYFSYSSGFWSGLIKPVFNEHRLKELVDITNSKLSHSSLNYDLHTILLLICLHNGALKLYKENVLMIMNTTSIGVMTNIQRQEKETCSNEVIPFLLDILGVMYRGMGYPQHSKKLHQLSFDIFDDENNACIFQSFENSCKEPDQVNKEKLLAKASTLHKLGIIHRYLGNLSYAQKCHETSLSLLETLYNVDHPFIAGSLLNFAVVHNRKGNMKNALRLQNRSLTIMEKTHGTRHPNVGRVLSTIGTVYYKLSKFDKAIEYTKRGLEILETFHGSSHPHVAEALNFLGFMYRDQGDLQNAQDCLERSVSKRKSLMPITSS